MFDREHRAKFLILHRRRRWSVSGHQRRFGRAPAITLAPASRLYVLSERSRGAISGITGKDGGRAVHSSVAGRRAPSGGLKTALPPRSSLSNSRVELFIATKGRRAPNARRNHPPDCGFGRGLPNCERAIGQKPLTQTIQCECSACAADRLSARLPWCWPVEAGLHEREPQRLGGKGGSLYSCRRFGELGALHTCSVI